MKNFSNNYIFTFSAIMVTLVAAVLAIVSIQLKPIQTKNIEAEKMQNILSSVGIDSEKKDIEEKFSKYITESYVINPRGEIIEGVAAFNVDLKKELVKIDEINNLKGQLVEKRMSPFKIFISGFIRSKKLDKSQVEKIITSEESNRLLPVYICEHTDGNIYYIFPLQGKGLWGPIWGYVSLESDMNTVFGAVFDHKGETPGLGAEIKQYWFGDRFKGKKIFEEDNTFKSIDVIKPGSAEITVYNVDAISGGTITSKGVQEMLFSNLEGYVEFIKNKRN